MSSVLVDASFMNLAEINPDKGRVNNSDPPPGYTRQPEDRHQQEPMLGREGHHSNQQSGHRESLSSSYYVDGSTLKGRSSCCGIGNASKALCLKFVGEFRKYYFYLMVFVLSHRLTIAQVNIHCNTCC